MDLTCARMIRYRSRRPQQNCFDLPVDTIPLVYSYYAPKRLYHTYKLEPQAIRPNGILASVFFCVIAIPITAL